MKKGKEETTQKTSSEPCEENARQAHKKEAQRGKIPENGQKIKRNQVLSKRDEENGQKKQEEGIKEGPFPGRDFCKGQHWTEICGGNIDRSGKEQQSYQRGKG